MQKLPGVHPWVNILMASRGLQHHVSTSESLGSLHVSQKHSGSAEPTLLDAFRLLFFFPAVLIFALPCCVAETCGVLAGLS